MNPEGTLRTAVLRSVSVVALAVLLPLASAALPANAPHVSKVEPPNWWTGFQPTVMVLLYGENLAAADISVAYPGVSVVKTQAQPDGKHAFAWLNLDSATRPGD